MFLTDGIAQTLGPQNDVPAGAVLMYAGSSAPLGYLLCDGTASYSTALYPKLYAAIGNTWGGTPGSTFAVPDMRGRMPLGEGQGSGLTNRTLGTTVGAETHTLSSSTQLPAHTHDFGTLATSGVDLSHTHTFNAGSHTHFVANTDTQNPVSVLLNSSNQLVGTGFGQGSSDYRLAGSGSAATIGKTDGVTVSGTTSGWSQAPSNTHSHSVNSGATGNGPGTSATIGHMNPASVLKFIIKY